MDKLTSEEAEKLYNENSKGLELNFTSYYKYSFSFEGENDVMKVSTSYGGNSDDIYRFDVDNRPIDAPESFARLMNEYYSVTIVEKATNKRFHSYHYN